jgi:hypothetical protein
MAWRHWLDTLPLRIRSLFRRADLGTDLNEQLRGHGDRKIEANIAREAWRWRMLDVLRRDGKHALRRLMKDWQFSVSAIVILALGIGANTAVFSILNNTLFQPHPFTDSKRLVNLYQNDAKSGEPEGVSYPAFLDLQMETAVFEGVAANNMTEGRYQTVDAQGRPGSIRVGLLEYASANHLDVLGLRPSLGRWFSADEERRNEPVAVLGWTAWTRTLAGIRVCSAGHSLSGEPPSR